MTVSFIFDACSPIPDITKDPVAFLDYGIDWVAWLAPVGDVLAISEWIAAPSGLTLSLDNRDLTQTVVWIAGGVLGTTYVVTNKITTLEGRIDERSFNMLVQHR